MARRRRRWPRILAGTASTLVLITTGAAAAGAVLYQELDSNISSLDVQDQLGPRPTKTADPTTPTEPMNILIMGSDTREGKGNNKRYGNETNAGIMGERSDTTILVHLAGDRSSALAVSIPRDSMVQLPMCKNADGQRVGGYTGRFNEAYNNGGPGCTVKAVEELTGVYVDHFVVVDFAGFKKMIEAIGGVEVCLDKPVNDYHSRLNLPAGKQTISGEQALAFVRARESLGDGSDLMRIQRQQDFIASIIRKMTSAGVLGNPLKLFKLLDAATSSLTTDPQLASLQSFQDIAESLQNMRPADVTFATVPNLYNNDGATVSWDPVRSKQLWNAIAADRQWPAPPTVPPGQEALTVPPSDIKVVVVNGTPTAGKADQVAAQLTEQGYQVMGVRSSKKSVTATTLRFDPADAEASRTLGYAAGATDIAAKDGLGNTMVLTVGKDFNKVKPVVTKTKKPAQNDTAATKTADTSICVS